LTFLAFAFLVLTFLILVAARGVVTDLLLSEFSFGSRFFTITLGARLVCLVRQAVFCAHLSVGSTMTDGFIDPSAIAMRALGAMMIIAFGTAFGHVWKLAGVD
jgi:hypothetical protein